MEKSFTLKPLVATNNWQALQQDLEWMAQVLEERDDFFLSEKEEETYCFEDLLIEIEAIPVQFDQFPDTAYCKLLQEVHCQTATFFALDPEAQAPQIEFLQYAERVLLLVALIPYLRPELFNFFRKKDADGDPYVEFGGIWGTNGAYQGFLPTGQTLVHILAGMDLERRALLNQLLSPTHYLSKRGIVKLGSLANDLPWFNGQLLLSEEYTDVLVKNHPYRPQYAEDFPATLLTTQKSWEDLILDEKTEILVQQAQKWVVHYPTVSQQGGTGSAMKGYRLLMSGPSGTGKTLTAALLGKTAGKPVYRIDISNIVDKYVGETSKRLRKVFDLAENHDWILFFDEGDALFGKRSSGGSQGNERYANQEVSYLLYKLEEYEGTIFLATNKGTAIDSAFERRFDTLIEFQKPDEYVRRALWQHFFAKPAVLQLAPEIFRDSWRELAEKGKVSGAWIEKFYQYCLMQATAKGTYTITADEMRQYIHWYSWERGYFEAAYKSLFKKKS